MDLLLKLSELYPWSPIERFGAKRYSKRMNGPFHSYLSNSPCPSKNWINSNMDVWFKENVKSCFVHGFRDHPFLVDQRSDSKPLYYSTVLCFIAFYVLERSYSLQPLYYHSTFGCFIALTSSSAMNGENLKILLSMSYYEEYEEEH